MQNYSWTLLLDLYSKQNNLNKIFLKINSQNPSINELCINECLECEYNKEYTNNLIKINEVNPVEEFEDLNEINGELSDYDKSKINFLKKILICDAENYFW